MVIIYLFVYIVLLFYVHFSDRHMTRDRNETSRFVEGESFKGKLIGVLEVSEARGDRMCQEALAELKMAVRAAGEHKQRILINIAMDGIRLRDERSGVCFSKFLFTYKIFFFLLKVQNFFNI